MSTASIYLFLSFKLYHQWYFHGLYFSKSHSNSVTSGIFTAYISPTLTHTLPHVVCPLPLSLIQILPLVLFTGTIYLSLIAISITSGMSTASIYLSLIQALSQVVCPLPLFIFLSFKLYHKWYVHCLYLYFSHSSSIISGMSTVSIYVSLIQALSPVVWSLPLYLFFSFKLYHQRYVHYLSLFLLIKLCYQQYAHYPYLSFSQPNSITSGMSTTPLSPYLIHNLSPVVCPLHFSLFLTIYTLSSGMWTTSLSYS
jgi:hypothetical protein